MHVTNVPQLKSRFWRSFVETKAKEVLLKNCLLSPEAALSQYQMECVSRHQNRSEPVAELHYRVPTVKTTEIFGKFVTFSVKEPLTERDTEPPTKRVQFSTKEIQNEPPHDLSKISDDEEPEKGSQILATAVEIFLKLKN